MQIWNERFHQIEIVRMNGTKKLNGTIDNAAATDVGGYATIPITAHGLTVGSTILIAGSVAYNGVHTIRTVPGVNTIQLYTAYTAEVFAGTETYGIIVKPSTDFQFVESRLILSAASGAENYVVKLDADAGATYDGTLITVAMNTLLQHIKVWMATDEHRFFEEGDALLFEYANASNRTWTLTVIYRVLA